MSNPTARPEAQEEKRYYVIRHHQCGGIDGAITSNSSPETIERFTEEWPDHEILTERPHPGDWCLCPKYAGTIRPVEVLPGDESEVDLAPLFHHAVRVQGGDWSRAEALPYEPYREQVPIRSDVETDPYPWEGRTKISVAIPNPDGWGPRPAPLPYEPEPWQATAVLAERTRRAWEWLDPIIAEVDRCQREHRPFASLHEALAIFEEEADELRHEVRHGTLEGVREEAIQAAAMLVRLLVDCGGEPPNGGGDDGE